MARVKGGAKANKRRRNILEAAKGFRFSRSKKTKAAKEALLKARSYAFRDRRNKKRVMRSLAIVKLNAGLRNLGVKSYSTFIGDAKKKNVELDRKVLSQLAEHHPEAFERTVKKITG